MGTELTPPAWVPRHPPEIPFTVWDNRLMLSDADKLRLARTVQFRELLTVLFNDPTPWGESVALQALADHLDADGHPEVADAVRGRYRAGVEDLQVTSHRVRVEGGVGYSVQDRGHLTNSRTVRATTHTVELAGTIYLDEERV